MPHEILDLNNADAPEHEEVHRPELRIWIDDAVTPPKVVLTVGALHGQQMRFVEMTSQEAMRLSNMLAQKGIAVRVMEEEYAKANRAEREAAARDARTEDEGDKAEAVGTA